MGPAGSGKTFVALHLMLQVLSSDPSAHILFVVTNTALAYFVAKWVWVRVSTKQGSREADAQRVLNQFHVLYGAALLKRASFEITGGLLTLKAPSETQPEIQPSFSLVVVDEAHDLIDGAAEKIAKHTKGSASSVPRLLLSDVSQACASTADAADVMSNLPAREGEWGERKVVLNEVVRCTKRIVEGARAFQTNDGDAVTICHHSADGPPLKVMLLSGKSNATRSEQYVLKVVEALAFLAGRLPGFNFHDRVTIIAPNSKFIEDIKPALEARVAIAFSDRTFHFTDATAASRSVAMGVCSRGAVAMQQSIVLDTMDNFNGLERLIVIAVDLDSPINLGAAAETRSQLYRAITRAQMMVVVVNEVLRGGWLEFLTCVKYNEENDFDMAQELRRNVKGKARRTVEEEAIRREHAEAMARQQKQELEQEREQQQGGNVEEKQATEVQEPQDEEGVEEGKQREEEWDQEEGEQEEGQLEEGQLEEQEQEKKEEEHKQEEVKWVGSTVWDTSTDQTAGTKGRSLDEIRDNGFMPFNGSSLAVAATSDEQFAEVDEVKFNAPPAPPVSQPGGSETNVNAALARCLQQVISEISAELAKSSHVWGFESSLLNPRFLAKRENGEILRVCECAKQLYYSKGTAGGTFEGGARCVTSLREVPRVQEILGCTSVETYICKSWAQHCREDHFFQSFRFDIGVRFKNGDASNACTGVQATCADVPLDLDVYCQTQEVKDTLFRRFYLAKNMSMVVPAAGDDNIKIQGGASKKLLGALVDRCYTSATFYSRFWVGNEQFAGTLRRGEFILAKLTSLIVEGKLAQEPLFEAVLDYIDECEPNQVSHATLAQKAGLSADEDADSWVPDAFLEPEKELRKQFLIAKIQQVQDRMLHCLSLFVGKHLERAYPTSAECPGGFLDVVRKGRWSGLFPQSSNVGEWDEYQMVKVCMRDLVDSDRPYCCNLFAWLRAGDGEKFFRLKHSLCILFAIRNHRAHTSPYLRPRAFIRYIVSIEKLLGLLVEGVTAPHGFGDTEFEQGWREALVWFADLRHQAIAVFRTDRAPMLNSSATDQIPRVSEVGTAGRSGELAPSAMREIRVSPLSLVSARENIILQAEAELAGAKAKTKFLAELPKEGSNFEASSRFQIQAEGELAGARAKLEVLRRAPLGGSEEQTFFRFLRVYHNVLPLAEEHLFRRLWIDRYPQQNPDGSFKYGWSDAMGAVFVDGSAFEEHVQLPGTFTVTHTKSVIIIATNESAKLVQNAPAALVTGSTYRAKVARSSGPAQTFDGSELRFDGCANKLDVSEDLTSSLSAGGWIRVGGEDVRVKEVKCTAYEKCVKLEERSFRGSAGTFAAVARLKRDVEPAMQHSGRAIERHVLKKLRQGDLTQWDSTAYFTALCGCTHRLLPAPMTEAQYQAITAAAAAPVSAAEEQAYRLDRIRIIRNIDDGHKPRAMMSATRFTEVIAEAKHFVCAFVCDDSTRRDQLLAQLVTIENEELQMGGQETVVDVVDQVVGVSA
jgi:hypothetical protein